MLRFLLHQEKIVADMVDMIQCALVGRMNPSIYSDTSCEEWEKLKGVSFLCHAFS
uniref:hypothetical protein n=1 Tax=Acetatifactor sp. TaxID=1872090 RepID=UPI0040566F54